MQYDNQPLHTLYPSQSQMANQSNPILPPDALTLLTAAESEIHADDVLEALRQRGFLESAAEVAKGDSGE